MTDLFVVKTPVLPEAVHGVHAPVDKDARPCIGKPLHFLANGIGAAPACKKKATLTRIAAMSARYLFIIFFGESSNEGSVNHLIPSGEFAF